MDFDVRPIPNSKVSTFTSRYMEAKVMEDFRLLNEITENYSLGYLTESCALAMLHILDQSEYTLMETAVDTAKTLNEESLDTALNITSIYPFGFVGEGVLPFKEIIKANDGESIYNAYTFERTWDDTTDVGKIATRIANEKEANLNTYKESEGADGFTVFERNLYKTYPDDRVDPFFLYENAIDAGILSGSISLEDGYMLKGFINTRFAYAENVESMMPIIPLTGEVLTPDLSNTNVKDMVASTDSEINDAEEEQNDDDNNDVVYGLIHTESSIDVVGNLLRESGAFIALEGVIYKNNIIFDSEAKKIFDKLKKDLKLSYPNDDNASFKSLINIKKNRYSFNFINQNIDPNMVTTTIISCGFKPIKENGVVVRYEKEVKGIKITIEFTSVDNGVIIFYENTKTVVVKESSIDDKIEFGMKCEVSDVKDAAKRVKKLKDSDNIDKDELDKAVAALDHAIENYKEVKDVKNDEESVKESYNHFNYHNISINFIREKSLLSYDYNEEFITNRRDEVMSIINTELFESVNTPNELSDYLESIMLSSPSRKVSDSFYNMCTNLFNSECENEKFTESVNLFVKNLINQNDEETICESVLNNIDFIEDAFSESSHDIDDDIKHIIELLNRLGYNVKYSCSGHNKTRIKEDNFRDGVYHGKLYTTARLTFDKKYNFKSIPEGWYINKNADTTSIYVRAFSYDEKDGTPNEAFEKWKDSYMKSLKKWVENLDKVEESDTDTKMESVMNDIFNEFLNSEPITTTEPIEESCIDFDNFIDSELNSLL